MGCGGGASGRTTASCPDDPSSIPLGRLISGASLIRSLVEVQRLLTFQIKIGLAVHLLTSKLNQHRTSKKTIG